MSDAIHPPIAPARDAGWLRAARWARWLAWASLLWMTVEGVLGIGAGLSAGSIALVAWALSSAVEGLASVIVIWRFTGFRTLSETAEGRAQKAVAISFFLLAPYVAVESVRDLLVHHEPGITVLGMALTATSVILMPVLGLAKRRLGARLGSGATAGEGGQNLLCAYLAAAVLVGLAGNALLGWWWLDRWPGWRWPAWRSRKGSTPGAARAATARPRLSRTHRTAAAPTIAVLASVRSEARRVPHGRCHGLRQAILTASWPMPAQDQAAADHRPRSASLAGRVTHGE